MGNDVLQTMSLFAKMVKKPIAAGCCILLSVIGSLPCVAADAYASKSARTDLEKKIDCHLLEERKKVDGQKNQNLPVTTLVEVRISCSDVAAISNAVLRFGGKVIDAYGRYRCVNARIPVAAVESLAAESGVTHVRKMPRGKPNKVNTSEGVSAHLVDEVRSTYGLTGKGVKIGVLSDSVDYLDDVQSMGDLPSVTVLDDDEGDGEGTAMLEIVHDVAPDAELYFATANKSVESFAENIRALADAGCKVIVDDYTYPNEPAFQDGIIAQAVADVTARGCLFFTSAANSGSLKMGASGTFEGDFVDTDGDGYMNFPDGKNYIELSKCAHWRVTLQWSDPWGASDNDYDLEIEWPDGTKSSGCDTQDGNDNPYEEIYGCCDGECDGAKIKVKKYSGEPRYIRIDTHRGRLTGGTAGNVYGHNASETAFSIGAASAQENESPFTNRAVMEDYSSDGPRRMFYAANGNPLTPGNLLASGGQILQKPDVVAADDVSCYTPSYDDWGDLMFTPFCGTSASAPHAAAIAALMLEKKSDLTREQLLEAWKSTSWRIDGPSWNACSGHGIINAKAAVQYVVDNFCSGDSTLANDNFANATALEGISGSVNATNVGATKEEGEPATYAGSPSTKTVWWTWTPTEDCKVTFSTEGSNFDTVLAVYTGDSLSSLDEVDSSDDYAQGIQWSKVAFSAVAGVTYRVVVGGYGGNEGQIQLCWEKSLEQDGTCYGLFVGINNFQFGWQDTLPGCISDVNNLSSALIDGAAWTDQTVTRLTNAAATKSAVRQKVGELAQTAQSGDTVLIYFSTHGGAEEDATYARVCLYGEDERYFDYELADDLAAFKSGVNVIMLLDTCSAAGMFKTDGSRVRKVSMAERVNAILEARNRTKGSKGKIDASEIGWLVSVDYDQEASGGDEGGSPFTSYCLVNPGLDDEEADLDGDGNISFQELYYFAYRSYCRNRQETPQALNVNVLRRVAAKGAIDYVAPAKPLYTVTFDAGEYALDFDEEYVIQDVEEGSAAVEPEVEGLEGFFYEWDRDFSCVMGDLAVSAEWDLVEDDPLEADFGGTKLTFARLGAPAWEIDDEDPIVLRSGTPDDGGMSVLKLTVQVEQASAKVSFKHKTSSEYRYDLLVVLVEDANAQAVSRESTSGVAQDWTDANITFPALGRYSISWVYMKDFEGDSAGDDCAYLKDFQLEGCTPVNDPIPQQQVAKPVLNPSGTTFTDSLTVTCSCSTGGATIRYTTDNSSVTESSDVWPSGGLKLTETTTVRAKAFKAGMDPSEEASQTYTKETSLEPVKAVSKFTMNGHQAVVCGVIGATADSFKSTDNCGNPCLIDIRIIDAEKSAEWVDDNYWCTALSQMDMLVWLGWAKDIGYEDEDALANYFRKNPSLLRTKPSDISGWPSEGQYGYNGVFDWFADQTGGQTLDVQSGSIGSSFLQVLQNSLQGGDALVRMDVVSDCTSNPWLSHGGEISHSVICCGYALDPAVSSTSPSALVGLFLIDSDNDQYAGAGGTSAPNSISYVSARWNGSRYDFTNVWGGRDGYADWSCVYDVLHAKPGYTPVGVKVGNDPTPPPSVDRVATPVLDPPSNMTFKTSLAVKCTCPTEGATIRFATNETDVITESFPVWADLTLTATTVIRVKAFKANMQASDEVKCVYTLDPEGGEQGNSSMWTDPVIDVGKKDRTEATAATTYTGWLHDSKGNLTASFTMKVGKANKNGIAKVTLTVTDLATGIKSKYTGNYNVEEGEIEGGQLDGLALGEDGVVGKIGKETLTGGRMANKTEAAAVDAVYKNRIFAFAFQNTAGKNVKGAATFTAKFSSKGKAKISGTLMDGTKVSTSAQLIVGDKACALPISFTKKGKANFGLVLWFNEKKATFKEATGLTECTLGDGVTDVKVEFVGCDEVDGTMAKAKALEVDGKKVADIAANGTKWVATAAKDFEDAKPKVTYAAKKGTITGTYKATVKGAAKPVSAKITGVWLGKTGVGTAVMKVNKVVTALPVVVK